jgi:hypothetical protein
MRPKCQMIDPTAPPGSQKSISSWTLKGSSPSEATSKKKKGKKGKEKKKDKAKGKVEVKSKIMVKWTVQQISELENINPTLFLMLALSDICRLVCLTSTQIASSMVKADANNS